MQEDASLYPETDAILDSAERARCIDLFEELEALKESIKVQKEREEEIEKELDHYQYMVDAPGIRHGLLTYSCQQVKGRRMLSQDRLMEAGVSRQVIDDCYVAGKPHERRVFRRIVEKEGLTHEE